MSTLPFALRDSATMLRRDLRHSLRNLPATVSGLLVPVLILVLFVYIFGGEIEAGLGRVSYINYLTPGILILSVGSSCTGTAINLCMDLNEGIIARFRTMAIFRGSILAGQVLGGLIRTMLSVCLVLALALLMGFSPSANALEWLEALGLIALFSFALTWIAVVFGLIGKTPAGANSLGLIFQLLAFTSSAIVNPDTMVEGVRWFARYQPFTPVINTLRGLLLGTPIGNDGILAIAWCLGLTLLGYILAQTTFNRSAVR